MFYNYLAGKAIEVLFYCCKLAPVCLPNARLFQVESANKSADTREGTHLQRKHRKKKTSRRQSNVLRSKVGVHFNARQHTFQRSSTRDWVISTHTRAGSFSIRIRSVTRVCREQINQKRHPKNKAVLSCICWRGC